ncbi:uncharacterized protein LOC127933243 [Carassius gibelio]|uniref:uncharacterized protein LOC127933243 n=1 Tax=Carassius gibelio TaxID=101364 RepID=UPI002278AEBA|nr:uncharacterized protein LOC127933243 [Carassius gibelio]XP_052386026.1 uncharacterized protein LOC127933243 [Carassius gibelio]
MRPLDQTLPQPARSAALQLKTSLLLWADFLSLWTVSHQKKKQRISEGFPGDRIFFDKWRNSQYAKREEYLLSHFTHRKPSAARVSKLIAQEGWKSNYPKPKEIERLWKPAPKLLIETDQTIMKCVSQQTWKGIAIKDFGPQLGLGVVATQRFSKGDIVCDYHGKVITAAAGRAMMQDIHDEAGYLFFFKAGQRELCIDAQTFPCECHPDADTFGRRINHSSKMPNLKPLHCVLKVNGEEKDVVLFKALQDISVDTQLKFVFQRRGPTHPASPGPKFGKIYHQTVATLTSVYM